MRRRDGNAMRAIYRTSVRGGALALAWMGLVSAASATPATAEQLSGAIVRLKSDGVKLRERLTGRKLPGSILKLTKKVEATAIDVHLKERLLLGLTSAPNIYENGQRGGYSVNSITLGGRGNSKVDPHINVTSTPAFMQSTSDQPMLRDPRLGVTSEAERFVRTWSTKGQNTSPQSVRGYSQVRTLFQIPAGIKLRGEVLPEGSHFVVSQSGQKMNLWFDNARGSLLAAQDHSSEHAYVLKPDGTAKGGFRVVRLAHEEAHELAVALAPSLERMRTSEVAQVKAILSERKLPPGMSRLIDKLVARALKPVSLKDLIWGNATSPISENSQNGPIVSVAGGKLSLTAEQVTVLGTFLKPISPGLKFRGKALPAGTHLLVLKGGAPKLLEPDATSASGYRVVKLTDAERTDLTASSAGQSYTIDADSKVVDNTAPGYGKVPTLQR